MWFRATLSSRKLQLFRGNFPCFSEKNSGNSGKRATTITPVGIGNLRIAEHFEIGCSHMGGWRVDTVWRENVKTKTSWCNSRHVSLYRRGEKEREREREGCGETRSWNAFSFSPLRLFRCHVPCHIRYPSNRNGAQSSVTERRSPRKRNSRVTHAIEYSSSCHYAPLFCVFYFLSLFLFFPSIPTRHPGGILNDLIDGIYRWKVERLVFKCELFYRLSVEMFQRFSISQRQFARHTLFTRAKKNLPLSLSLGRLFFKQPALCLILNMLRPGSPDGDELFFSFFFLLLSITFAFLSLVILTWVLLLVPSIFILFLFLAFLSLSFSIFFIF